MDSVSKKDLTEEDIKTRYITPALNRAGWPCDRLFMEKSVKLTDGRILVQGRKCSRQAAKRVDYLLYLDTELPIAVVEAKDNNQPVSGGLQQAIAYAQMLDVPFAFSSNGDGFRMHDLVNGTEVSYSMDDFPSPEDLRSRYWKYHDLTSDERRIVAEPYYYNVGTHRPRYYQRIAINRTVEFVAKGRKRLLLVMATGTGKTYTAFQIIHRLRRSGLKRKILYLADRNMLIDQTMKQDFAPFKKVMTKVQGKEASESFEIFMSLYGQWVEYDRKSQSEDGEIVTDGIPQPYEKFARDFFDLIVVDECHRGSVRADSEWRKILEYFAPATQIGLTATPKQIDGADNIEYFCTETKGVPVYTYSLQQGIEDGFLAPYRVTRSFLSIDLEGWTPSAGEKDLFDNLIDQRKFARPDMGRKLAVETRRRVVARRTVEKLREIGTMTKTIVFCSDQEEAAAMRDLIAELCPEEMKKNPRYVMRITSNDVEGKKQLDNFIDADEKYPVVATTSELLTTGADCKTCGLLVIDKEVSNMTIFKQMVGRGTRINEEHDKYYFEILDFRNVTIKFEEPGFLEPADTSGHVRKKGDGGGDGPGLDPIDPAKPNKFHIKGGEVNVAHEMVQFLGADGRLQTESIRDYTKKAITGRYATMDDFVRRWNAAERKQAILDELKDCDVPVLIEAVTEANPSLADKDVFDIILHVAYDQKPLTRRERAENVKKRNYLAKYEGKAREVLAALLEKYADRGVLELENEDVLELPPFNLIGMPRKIVGLFGGAANFDRAIRELEEELYREAV